MHSEHPFVFYDNPTNLARYIFMRRLDPSDIKRGEINSSDIGRIENVDKLVPCAGFEVEDLLFAKNAIEAQLEVGINL